MTLVTDDILSNSQLSTTLSQVYTDRLDFLVRGMSAQFAATAQQMSEVHIIIRGFYGDLTFRLDEDKFDEGKYFINVRVNENKLLRRVCSCSVRLHANSTILKS
jgi:regulator of sirC expression with transglutaminase-like and TPR domain